MIANLVERLTRGLLRRRSLAASVLAVGTLLAILALPHLRIDPDIGRLFPREHEAVELSRVVDGDRESSRTILLVLRGDDLDARLPRLVERMSASPRIEHVAATREELLGDDELVAPLWSLPAESVDEVEDLLSGPGREAAIAASVERLAVDPIGGREVVLRDPLGVRWIVDRALRDALPPGVDPDSPYLLLDEGRVAILRVRGAREPFDVEFSRALLGDLEELVGELELRAIGGYAVARDDSARIRGDLVRSLAWSVPLLALFLALSTRSGLRSVLHVVPVGFAVVWTLGIGGTLLGPLSPLAVSSIAILVGLGVDYAIHYLARYREERARAGVQDALSTSSGRTARALAGGAATSIVAFLSVSFGEFTGLVDFGLLVAIGLLCALLATWTVLPLATTALDARARAGAEGTPGATARAPRSLPAERELSLAILALAVLGWLVVAARGLDFDADPAHLRPADAALEAEVQELAGELGFWPFPIALLVPADVPLEALADALEETAHANGIARTAGPHARRGGADRRSRVAGFRERTRGWVAGALGDLRAAGLAPEPFRKELERLDELLAADPPGPSEGERVFWRGREHWRVELYPATRVLDAERRARVRAELESALGRPARLVDSVELARELGRTLARDLRDAVLLCAVAVLACTVASLGSLRAGLVALVPSFAGLGVTLGTISVLGWPLSPGNFVAVPLVLGLGVDDGIHMVHRLREDGRRAVTTTGVAIWRTSMCTLIGFGSLVAARTPAISSLGAIVAIGTIACFLTSVVLLPRLQERSWPDSSSRCS